MGGKYEIIGWCYPYQGWNDLHEYTNSLWEALKYYRKARKMFYYAFIVRNDKNARYNPYTGEVEQGERE